VGEDDSDLLLEVFDEIGCDAPAELDDGGEIRERGGGAFGSAHASSL
jgi:hypothetical protein